MVAMADPGLLSLIGAQFLPDDLVPIVLWVPWDRVVAYMTGMTVGYSPGDHLVKSLTEVRRLGCLMM